MRSSLKILSSGLQWSILNKYLNVRQCSELSSCKHESIWTHFDDRRSAIDDPLQLERASIAIHFTWRIDLPDHHLKCKLRMHIILLHALQLLYKCSTLSYSYGYLKLASLLLQYCSINLQVYYYSTAS